MSRLNLDRIYPTPGGSSVIIEDGNRADALVVRDDATDANLLRDRRHLLHRAHGIIGDGVADDHPAITAYIAGRPIGARVEVDIATYRLAATLLLDKKLRWVSEASLASSGGTAWVDGAVFEGTGMPILRMTVPSTLENIAARDPKGHASSIGLEIDNGPSRDPRAGVARWRLYDPLLIGTGRSGIGLRLRFALKGTVREGAIEGWDIGVLLLDESNANGFYDTSIRMNRIGVFVPADAGLDNLPLHNVYLEGNVEAGLHALSGRISPRACHVENDRATGLRIGGTARLVSRDGGYYGHAPNSDIVIEGGNTENHISDGEEFNSGVTHNGSGWLLIRDPRSNFLNLNRGHPVRGAGKVILQLGNRFIGFNTETSIYEMEGWGGPLSTAGWLATSPNGTLYRNRPQNGGGNGWSPI